MEKKIWVLVFSLLLAACGGNKSADQSSSTSSQSTAAPTPTPTPTPEPSTDPIDGDGDCVDLSTDTADLRLIREQVCVLVNIERQKVGAAPLKLEVKRTLAAQNHAIDMFERKYFSHYSPDGDSPVDRLRDVGVTASYWGENIASGSTTAQGVMNQWMGSAGHKANILNPNFKQLGVGYYNRLWVQVFTN